jgi:hypothetical protein
MMRPPLGASSTCRVVPEGRRLVTKGLGCKAGR